MKEFKVTWSARRAPGAARPPLRLLFVDADTEADAKILARNHIERKHGISPFIQFIEEVKGSLPAGQVKE